MAKVFKFAICDDEEIYTQAIEEKIIQHFSCSQNDVRIERFSNVESLLETDLDYDFLFLDIEMPQMSGIEAREIIELRDKDIGIIFVTNYQEHMKKAFGKNVRDFIDKNQLDVSKILTKIERDYNLYNVIDIAGDMVETKTILYLEAKDSSTIVVSLDQKPRIFGIYLKKLHERINKDAFVRCHKSYIVNLKYIKRIHFDHLVLRNGVEIPLSRKYQEGFKDIYVEYARENSL